MPSQYDSIYGPDRGPVAIYVLVAEYLDPFVTPLRAWDPLYVGRTLRPAFREAAHLGRHCHIPRMSDLIHLMAACGRGTCLRVIERVPEDEAVVAERGWIRLGLELLGWGLFNRTSLPPRLEGHLRAYGDL